MLQGYDMYSVAQLSLWFQGLWFIPPYLGITIVQCQLFNVLSLHTHQTYKGVQFTCIWRFSVDISSAIMLGVSCYATSPCENQLALRETSLPFSKPMFSPCTAGWRVVRCVPTFLIYLFYMPPSSPTLFQVLGTNLSVWRGENLKKNYIYSSWLLPSERKYFSSSWQSFKEWESYLLCLFARCNAKRSLQHQKNNHYPMFWWCCSK